MLEGNPTKTSSPTLVAYLDQAQPVVKSPEKEKKQTPVIEENNVSDSNQMTHQPPPPSFLRGSPWLRRPIENRNPSAITNPQQNLLIQIENSIPEDVNTVDPSPIVCKRDSSSSLFNCQGLVNKPFNNKVADVLNRKALEKNLALPNCITLEMLQKKWHAIACHL